MIYSPVLPLPLIIVLACILLTGSAFLSYRANQTFSIKMRLFLSVLYLLGLSGILFILTNPGLLTTSSIKAKPLWIVARDSSLSMNAPMQDKPLTPTRLDEAHKALKLIAPYANEDRELSWLAVDKTIQSVESAEDLIKLPATGTDSRLSQSLDNALRAAKSEGKDIKGILLLSDGRELSPRYLPSLLQSAGAQGIPIHTLPFGGLWKAPDLVLHTNKSLINAYPGNVVLLGASLSNTLPTDIQTQVSLKNAQGDIIDKKIVQIPSMKESAVSFSFNAPEKSEEYTMSCEIHPGETREDNNKQGFSVRIIKSKIRVFLAEGSPYWDSKFLAQLLRKQNAFDIKSVHRLTRDRYYQINTGEDNSSPLPDAGIPTTREDFLNFNIILIGKGAEHILTPPRVAELKQFIIENGGLLVFIRGKSYAGKNESIAELEPFTWKETMGGEHRLTPSTEGEHDGLFGQSLPGIESDIWKNLPTLEDIWEVDSIHADTRILARSHDKKTPMLAVRRMGMGAVAMINGDGLWKWDFYPEARRLGNYYEEFWGQFLPWIQVASEFMPGYDHSLHIDKGVLLEGEPVLYTISSRGSETNEDMSVELVSVQSPHQPLLKTQAHYEGKKAGLPRWKGEIVAPSPGDYILRLNIPNRPKEGSPEAEGLSPIPEVRIKVNPPPSEQDNLNADPAWLASLSEQTGGLFITPDKYDTDLPKVFKIHENTSLTEERFTPLWNRWWILLLLCSPFALYWHIRRRQGLL